MNRSVYDQIFTLDNIRLQWKYFWQDNKSQSSAGIDGITPALFNASIGKNLSDLYQSLRKGYVFSSLRPFPVEKSNGKKRIICIPTVRDRIVQRLLVEYFYEKSDKLGIINSASYGFVRSKEGNPRGVAAARDRAIILRKKHPWAYKSDIEAFFDTIARKRVIDLAIASLRNPSLRKILTLAIDCEIDQSNPALLRIANENGLLVGSGIRQGMPLAPLLSNVILRNFDNEMLKRGYNLVRYADDFIVLAKSEQECMEVDSCARELLGKEGFQLPSMDGLGKTRIASPLEGIDFLGLSLEPDKSGSFSLILTKNQLSQIKFQLSKFKDVDGLVKVGVYFADVARKIDAMAGGFRAAYRCASNYEMLDRILTDVSQHTMREILEKAFCPEAVKALRKQHKIFFGMEAPKAPLRRRRAP